MLRTLALLGTLVVVLGLAPSCELAAGQILALFEFTVVPAEVTIAAGDSQSVQIEIKPLTGVVLSAVSVRLVSAPSGVSADPSTLLVFSQATWSIAVAPSVAAGAYQLQIEAVSQGLNLLPVTRTQTLALVVTEAP